ncbi:alpha/beta hydrolase family esterase [Stieleria varia]|uniref:Alpha/beta hydrolase family protein n=1 Tax=Stieleria varia TaxID=2528005 RepID=A0A5C6BAF3_9BACT|nr:hypothetical protein [Stieleria varia]TWU07484.1 hypothetical protein Pla52n_00570 [Stieleria varia]
MRVLTEPRCFYYVRIGRLLLVGIMLLVSSWNCEFSLGQQDANAGQPSRGKSFRDAIAELDLDAAQRRDIGKALLEFGRAARDGRQPGRQGGPSREAALEKLRKEVESILGTEQMRILNEKLGGLSGTPVPEGAIHREWSIAGVKREALIFLPKSAQPGAQAESGAKTGGGAGRLPIVFGFHGHGGSMAQAARSFHLHQVWPEAIVVYPHGLPTPGITDPQGVRAGWQKTQGDQGDRDLAFFDAMLSTVIKQYGGDPEQVFSTGHSNGGAMSYLLWTARGEKLRAIAPSAAGSGALRKGTPPPIPVFHIAGRKDPLVLFAVQQLTIAQVGRINGCDSQSQPWQGVAEVYRSTRSAPLYVWRHDGTHKYPDRAPELIVAFFREVSRGEPSSEK